MKRAIIKPDEHVFIGGRTGSGKSFLVRKYLAGFENVVVLDTKGTVEWPEISKEEKTLVRCLTDLSRVETPKIIYRPVWEEHTQAHFNSFFQWCYMRQNCVVWVDEVFTVSPNPQVLPPYYRAILTQGRELGVAAWSLSQRPAGISALPISEASHFFIFDLNMPQDRRKIVDVTGVTEFYQKPGKYNFWYYHVTGMDYAVKARLVERRGTRNG